MESPWKRDFAKDLFTNFKLFKKLMLGFVPFFKINFYC